MTDPQQEAQDNVGKKYGYKDDAPKHHKRGGITKAVVGDAERKRKRSAEKKARKKNRR